MCSTSLKISSPCAVQDYNTCLYAIQVYITSWCMQYKFTKLVGMQYKFTKLVGVQYMFTTLVGVQYMFTTLVGVQYKFTTLVGVQYMFTTLVSMIEMMDVSEEFGSVTHIDKPQTSIRCHAIRWKQFLRKCRLRQFYQGISG